MSHNRLDLLITAPAAREQLDHVVVVVIGHLAVRKPALRIAVIFHGEQ